MAPQTKQVVEGDSPGYLIFKNELLTKLSKQEVKADGSASWDSFAWHSWQNLPEKRKTRFWHLAIKAYHHMEMQNAADEIRHLEVPDNIRIFYVKMRRHYRLKFPRCNASFWILQALIEWASLDERKRGKITRRVPRVLRQRVLQQGTEADSQPKAGRSETSIGARGPQGGRKRKASSAAPEARPAKRGRGRPPHDAAAGRKKQRGRNESALSRREVSAIALALSKASGRKDSSGKAGTRTLQDVAKKVAKRGVAAAARKMLAKVAPMFREEEEAPAEPQASTSAESLAAQEQVEGGNYAGEPPVDV